MSGLPDRPEDEASDRPHRDGEEIVRLREVSEDELRKIFKAHEKWLQSESKKGERADLSRTNLRGKNLEAVNLMEANLEGADLVGANLFRINLQRARLINANLEGANLSRADLVSVRLVGANLRGANLSRADLQGARLRDADLQGAILIEANLEGANLAHVTGLQEAKLLDINLTDATGLLGEEFARADVTGTRLPGDIREFKLLGVVDETSRNARIIFLSMLLVCAYFWLTIGTTTDARLLTNSASSPLPIIGTEIPIVWFYWAAPVLVVIGYVYFHFHLARLWRGFAGLPARFPDGCRLDERAYPWLLNGLVRRHFERLRHDRPLIARLEELVTIFLAWWIVPGTLFGFWLNYLPRHEWGGTGLHIGLLVVSVAAGILFYSSAARTLRGDAPRPFRWKACWRDRRAYQGLVVTLVGVVFFGLSYGAINGVRTTNPDFTNIREWVPWALENLGRSPFAILREEDVSWKPPDYWRMDPQQRIESVKGASLGNRDLRYADGVGAYMANADLRNADLEGAQFDGANLEGAKLGGAVFKRTSLIGANLRNVRLSKGTRNVNFRGANLDGAILAEATLQHADFQGASLVEANLIDAYLVAGKLDGARLMRAELDGVKLVTANLEGADLSDASLVDARLGFSNFAGARLFGADLRNADFIGAELRGADLRNAKDLTREQLDSACGDADTKLPEYLGNYEMKRCQEEGR